MRTLRTISLLALLLAAGASAQAGCGQAAGSEYPRALQKTPPPALPATAADSIVGQNAWKVTTIDSSLVAKPEETAAAKKGNALFALQFETVGDFDAAQKRRWALSARTGYGLYLVFDSPFYKIRGGSFATKEEADQAVRNLQDSTGVTALVIKVR